MLSSLHIEFPKDLPVSTKRDQVMAALAAHQVTIVCGKTGSGKTTPLPKIALAMGRGLCNYPTTLADGRPAPRRIAASRVAKRIAEDWKTPQGEAVGFKVWFQDPLLRLRHHHHRRGT